MDNPLPKPFPLLHHVRAYVDGAFREQCLFDAGDDLSLITCRREAGRYTLGICNNSWLERPLKIASHCGEIESMRELPLDQSDKTAVGYLPEGLEKAQVGASGPDRIAGGDVRVFDVRVREENVDTIPHAVPPPRPKGRILPLRNVRSVKQEVLARPTFFEHFDGVLVDWTYLYRSENDELRREAGWIQRQGLRVLVDLSPGINLFPDLRLVDNIKEEYEASMATIDRVLAKMAILGARDLVMSLHRQPENNYKEAQTQTDFDKTMRQICKTAEARDITVHLRISPGKLPWGLQAAVDFIERVGAANLRLAPSVAMLLAQPTDPMKTAEIIRDKVGLWLVAAPEHDVAGRLWSTHTGIAQFERKKDMAAILGIAADKPIILDVVYCDKDAEYLDAQALSRLMTEGTTSKPQDTPARHTSSEHGAAN